MEETFREATLAARNSEEQLGEVRRVHSTNALERDRADREHRYQSEQIVNLNNRLEALHGEISSIDVRLELAASEIERLRSEDEKESADAAAAEEILRKAEGLFAEKADATTAIEAVLEQCRAELLRHSAAVERFDEIGRQLNLNSERLSERLSGLAAEARRGELAFEEHARDAETLGKGLAAEREKFAELEVEKKEMLALASSAREALQAADKSLADIREETARTSNRLDTLRELEEKRAVYTPQIQRLFAETDAVGVSPLGVLADLIKVDEADEAAVESLFGPYLQTVLVTSVQEAKKISQWVDSNRIGRVATLVVPNDVIDAPRSAKAGSIADRLGISDKLAEILSDVFPREMSATVVDDVYSDTTGKNFSVDRKGDLLIGGKLFIGGRHDADEKNASLLVFKRELSGLEKTLKKLLGESEKASAAVAESARGVLVELEEKTVDLQSLIIKVERGILTMEANERSLKHEIERSGRHRQVVAAEAAQIKAEIEDIATKTAENVERHDAAEAARLAALAERDKVSAELVLRELRQTTKTRS